MSQTLNVSDVFSRAAGAGELSKKALVSLSAVDLGSRIQEALGVPADQFRASEAFMLTLVIDDTGSIASAGNEQTIRDGVNEVLEALQGSGARNDILVHVVYLVDGVLYPYTGLKQAPRLSSGNYRADGSHTPLFDQSLAVLAGVIVKEQEYADQGIPVRSVTCIVTDGADNSSRARAEDVAPVIADLLKKENHIVMGMGIDDGHTDFRGVFLRMGIPDHQILTPSNDRSAIRRAFNVVSQKSATASQGAAGFSQVMGGGFGAAK